MTLPAANTPLYNHPLPALEDWLSHSGWERRNDDIHCWQLSRPDWNAELCLEVDHLTVCYSDFESGRDRTVTRSFKYSLTREDVEAAIFEGP